MNPYTSQLFLSGRTDRVNQLAHVSLVDGANNTSVGVNTSYVRGRENTIVGAYAGVLDATSRSVVLVGERTGNSAQTAIESVAIGARAMSHAVMTQQSVFVGANTATHARRTVLTTAVGYGAGSHLSTALRTTLVGGLSGQFAFNSLDDTFVGYSSGRLCREGSRNAALGAFSGHRLETGSENVLVGYRAGANIESADRCVAVGAGALEFAANASNVIAIGTRAGQFAAGAKDAVFIGGWSSTMAGVEGGSNNVFIGMNNGSGGSDNVGLGTGVMPNVSGSYNVGLGTGAGMSLEDGDSNVLIGSRAGANIRSGIQNVAVGVYSGNAGSNNTTIGFGASSHNEGHNNASLGTATGPAGNSWQNTVMGFNTAARMRGDKNVVIGANAALLGNASNNVVVGTESCAVLEGSDNVIVGADMAIDRPMDSSIMVGSGFAQDYDLRRVSNAVIIGKDITLSNRDSDCLVLHTKNLGEVVRASRESVTFGAGVLITQTNEDNIMGPGNTLIIDDRYLGSGPYVAVDQARVVVEAPTRGGFVAQSPTTTQPVTPSTDLWYDWRLFNTNELPQSTADASDGFYGPRGDRLYVADSPQVPFAALPYVSSAPYNYLDPQALWVSYDIPLFRIQGVEYSKVYVHVRGMITFGNDALGSPLPVGQQYVNGRAGRVLGPTLYFGQGVFEMEASYKIGPIYPAHTLDHVAQTGIKAGLNSDAVVIRWEGFNRGGGGTTRLIAEITMFPCGQADGIVRLAWNPVGWPFASGDIVFAGLDSCRLAAVSSSYASSTNVAYWYAKAAPALLQPFSSWLAMFPVMPEFECTAVRLKTPLQLFGLSFEEVFVFLDGSVSFGSPEQSAAVPSLHIGKSPNPTTTYANRYNAVYCLMDADQLPDLAWWDTDVVAPNSLNTYLRVELAKDSASHYIVELVFAPTELTVVYSDAFTNAVDDAAFRLTYQGATYPIPHSSKRSYTLSTNDLPPHVFAGGKVRLDDAGVKVTNGMYHGDGGRLSNISVSALTGNLSTLLFDTKLEGDGGFLSNVRAQHMRWDADVLTANSILLTNGASIMVRAPGVLYGNGAGLTGIPPSAIIGAFAPNLYGGVWDSPASVHAIPWSQVSTQFETANNSLGYVVVNASDLAQVDARHATALVSVARNSGGSKVSVLHVNYQANAAGGTLATFGIAATYDGLAVHTDADCSVSVSPMVGTIDKLLSSNIAWNSDLTVPSPFVLSGNGSGLRGILAENIVGFPTIGGDGGSLSNVRSANIQWASNVVLPGPYVFAGNGAGLTGILAENVVGAIRDVHSSNIQWNSHLALPHQYAYSGNGAGLMGIRAENIIGAIPPSLTGTWDTPSNVHVVPWANVATQLESENNSLGYVVVSASDLAIANAKHVTALASIARNSSGGKVSVLHVTHQANASGHSVGTFRIAATTQGLEVHTDADCAVSVSPTLGLMGGALASNVQSSNVQWNSDLVLPQPYAYSGNGAGLTGIRAENIIGSVPPPLTGIWDAPSNVHIVPWANVATQLESEHNSLGYVVISASDLAIANAKHATALASIARNSSGADISVLHVNYQANASGHAIETFEIVATTQGLEVRTDADCAVSVSPTLGIVETIRSSNVVWSSDIVLPAPYTFIGNGSGLTGIRAENIAGLLTNLRSNTIEWNSNLSLPAPFVYSGNGAGLTGIRAENVVGALTNVRSANIHWNSDLSLPPSYVFRGNGAGLTGILAENIVGMSLAVPPSLISTWDAPSNVHVIPWANVATQLESETNSLGYVVISASDLAVANAKHVTALASIARNSSGGKVSVLHVNYQANATGATLTTFGIVATTQGLEVHTDPDCAVSVSPTLGIVETMLSSNIAWNSNLSLPAPFVYSGNGAGLTGIRAENVQGALHSANIQWNSSLVLPQPYAYSGNGAGLTGIRAENIIGPAPPSIAGTWDAPSNVHVVPWANVATQLESENNSLGYVVVSASDLAIANAKHATALVSIARNSSGADISVLHVNYQANASGHTIETFEIVPTVQGLQVRTDAGCAVSVSPTLGIVQSMLSSNIVWSSDLAVPAPYKFTGNGAGLTLPAKNLVGNLANLVVDGVFLSGKNGITTGFGGGPRISQHGWDAPGATHTLPWSGVAGECDNVTGILHIHASCKSSLKKQGVATASIVKNVGDPPDVLVTGTHTSPNLSTFLVSVQVNDIVVSTDAECAVCWTFIAAV